MTTALKTLIATALVAAFAVPAFADNAQLAASAGLTMGEAQGLTLNEIAAEKAQFEDDEWNY